MTLSRRVPAWAFASMILVAAASSVCSSFGQVSREAAAGVDRDDLDRVEDDFLARQAFTENCLMCHGEEMTSHQRLTAKQWNAEVEKMIAWGSPVPADRKGLLVDYLTTNFPASRTRSTLDRVDPSSEVARSTGEPPLDWSGRDRSADPERGRTLFLEHCSTCHGPDARGGEIGINLIGRPVLVHEQQFFDILDRGRRRMPNFSAVVDPVRKDDIIAWLRSQSR